MNTPHEQSTPQIPLTRREVREQQLQTLQANSLPRRIGRFVNSIPLMPPSMPIGQASEPRDGITYTGTTYDDYL